MLNLELSDWLYLGGAVLLIIVVLVALKMSYTAKASLPLPSTRPRFCLLPKYVVSLPLEGPDVEGDLSSRLALYGFQELRRDANAVVYSRGSAVGDFSIKIAKLVVTATFPLSNPARLNIEYGVAFGCAFDTGDLWKFCRELTEKIEVTIDRKESDPIETGNPYQSPKI